MGRKCTASQVLAHIIHTLVYRIFRKFQVLDTIMHLLNRKVKRMRHFMNQSCQKVIRCCTVVLPQLWFSESVFGFFVGRKKGKFHAQGKEMMNKAKDKVVKASSGNRRGYSDLEKGNKHVVILTVLP